MASSINGIGTTFPIMWLHFSRAEGEFMKTYIDLTKRSGMVAIGLGKAWEFKSQSKTFQSRTPSEGFRPLLPSEVSQSSRQQSSKELYPHQRNAAENLSPRNLLHQICEELGVYHYGN